MRTPPVLAPLALLLAAAPGCSPAGSRPNVVLISLDTCRRDRLGCYGYDRPTTPVLDELARESVLFEDCLAQSTATAPSHTSLLTGQYVRRHGLRANGQSRFPHATLASELRDAGYHTGGFTGHGSFQEIFGHGVGFDVFQSWPGKQYRDRPFTHQTRNLSDVIPHALDWVDTLGRDQPFFLLVHGYDPHCPYEPPEAYQRGLVGPYHGDLRLEGECGMSAFQELVSREDWSGSEDERHLSETYDAELRMADDAIGRLLEALRERGLYEDTLVVFTSDHGELLGEHGWVGHTRIFEPELEVPLLIRFPGNEPAGRFPDPVEHVDLVPTLLGYLGLVPSPGGQGVDLMPRLLGRAPEPTAERMRLAQIGKLVAVRFGERWKAVLGEDVRGQFPDGALFDLQEDPGETHNLLETPEGRTRYEALVARFEAWSRDTAAADRLYQGVPGDLSPEAVQAIQEGLGAIGYADGQDEDDGQDENKDEKR